MDPLTDLLIWEQVRAQRVPSPPPRGGRGDGGPLRGEGRGGTPGEGWAEIQRELQELRRRMVQLEKQSTLVEEQRQECEGLMKLLQRKSEENQCVAMELDALKARFDQLERKTKGDNSSDVMKVQDDSFARLQKAASSKKTPQEKALAVLRHLFSDKMKKAKLQEGKELDPFPELIMEFCFRIEQAVGTKVRDFGRQLGLPPEDVETACQGTLGLQDQFWRVIALWRRTLGCYVAISHLVAACQKCAVSVGKDLGPMSREDVEFLQRQLDVLLEQVILEPLLLELIKCEDFSRCAHLYVQGSGTAEPRSDQVLRLLDVLPMLGERALPQLFLCLENSEQGHVRQQLEDAYKQHLADFSFLEVERKRARSCPARRLDDGYASLSLSRSMGASQSFSSSSERKTKESGRSDFPLKGARIHSA